MRSALTEQAMGKMSYGEMQRLKNATPRQNQALGQLSNREVDILMRVFGDDLEPQVYGDISSREAELDQYYADLHEERMRERMAINEANARQPQEMNHIEAAMDPIFGGIASAIMEQYGNVPAMSPSGTPRRNQW
jgi:hypothetical protein